MTRHNSLEYDPELCARLAVEAREDCDRSRLDGRGLLSARQCNNLRATADQLDAARAEVERLTAAVTAKGDSLSRAVTCWSFPQEDPAVMIRRFRQRLYVIEPVYRAAVALHRNGAIETRERLDRVERAVARALDTEREIAEGGSISDADLDVEVPR